MISSAILACLTLNLYHEARGEPLSGQIAVVHVVMNRAKRNMSTPCVEVYRHKQFSWTHYKMRPVDVKQYLRLQRVVKQALRTRDITKGATHYHAAHIRPYWSHKMKYVGQWGNHMFYKEK
jgi:spore germination cell wall hydrolase CwlJ-like protein